ncbi:hypothetical protein O181_040006 [Austropuccinia psidii MF-1]|uniref:Uncharacterized protein n=1 Tax=Austropuccinia psidii MF-1 TaxID=1389203 RepID=A0A9Q3HD03_9BASI|nr:hypothetical protein [Austropuccinia psidii MF-1]
MDNKRFNLASHWAELRESFQKTYLKEIDFEELIAITKGWNPTRQLRLLRGKGNQDKGESSHYSSYRRTAGPDRDYYDSFRLPRTRPTQISNGFTPIRHQRISGQEWPFFTIPGSF